jgi:carbon-monoxide dehydrogenase medium subunit
VAIEQLLLGHAPHALEPGELIIEISVAAPARGQRFTYEKLKFTDGCSLIVGVACAADVDEGGVVRSLQMAIGGATETPLRLAEVESLVAGNAMTLELLDAAAEETRRALAEPLSDVMADGAYRRRVAGSLVKRALGSLADSDGGAT